MGTSSARPDMTSIAGFDLEASAPERRVCSRLGLEHTMSDAVAGRALAEGRVRKAQEIVVRQRALVDRCQLSGQPSVEQADLLRLFEENLAIFEQHAALLRVAAPVVPLRP